MNFAKLGLIEPLLRTLQQLDYTTPTPVQAKAIPAVLAGRDLMAAAQTGTGKTAGFALPVLQRLALEGEKVASNSIRALVLVPTRELAEQVHNNVREYAENLPLSTYAVYGGVSINPQMMRLRRGVDLLVATPGRLLDLFRQNAVKFNQVQTLVLDEADRMLDLGFAEELQSVYAALPRKRQTLLFSATFSDQIRMLAGLALNDPLSIEVSPRNATAASVKQWLVPVDKKRKADLFCHLLRKQRWKQVLVFAKTRNGVDQLVERLLAEGVNADGIHGDRPQATRQRALDSFKAREVQVLVATDVAARGLDIDDLPLVVNLDLPIVAEDYVHRIGRTGRAGNKGEAISLVCADEVQLLAAIEVLTRQTLPRHEEPDFIPEHRVPMTDASGQVIKKPKKPKKPKENSAKRGLGRWMDSSEAGSAEPAVKAVRKVPSFNGGPRKRKP
ncbi:DEAD/DEAH box helicase [Pseudomonas putida]|jgi:ATP-dependent RNA helicase RhlE|uniref:DEAD-box ATP-dependent RNA helicase RhpA n=3 Tax=Pseudomonas putida TaxID=303 RepID=A0AA34RVF7_PSEPU|nr:MULTISPECIES: DEAD/DEAH box helicase [Pseudomonas]ADR62087.1 DEAD/DEAH box helicase domain-containing protein [Pseudomonas putida BIRD-1]AFO50736.1 DEAD/DEAH box helicase domain-containing protein [Pseudomonas putida DOT-T1E]AJA14209.1 DEAD/DEAH box helicase [Pseudomonas putida S12]AOX11204.1 DEAD/DEAH box helicase [Pseudomonas putida JB]MCI1021127.1 DEAD/DEAH box helicase [Pseudomonas putida]